MSLSKLLFSFEGRIARAPFWYYVIGLLVVSVIARVIDSGIGGQAANSQSGYGCLTVIVGFGGILTTLAVCIKRCHDRDRSGWYLLLGLIPIVGALWLLVELGFRRGTIGQNEYGPDPLGGSRLLSQGTPLQP